MGAGRSRRAPARSCHVAITALGGFEYLRSRRCALAAPGARVDEETGIKRLICVTGIGAGDSRDKGGFHHGGTEENNERVPNYSRHN